MRVLVLMVIRARRLRHAVAELHRGLVINVVRRIINIVVAERVTHPEAELLVTVNTQLVIVRRIIHGTEVPVYVIVVSNMRVAVLERPVRERPVVGSISYVYVQVIMFRFVM